MDLTKLSDEQILNLPVELVSLYNVSVLKKVAKLGYDLHQRSPDTGNTLLHLYAKKGWLTHIKFLLASGVNKNITNFIGDKAVTQTNYIYRNSPGWRNRTKIIKMLK